MPSLFEFVKKTNHLRSPSIFLLGIMFVASCREDNLVTQRGTGNFSLTDVVLDEQPFRYSYLNVSTSPSIALTFSDRIDHQSAQANIALSTTSAVTPVTLSFSDHDSSVTVMPIAPLKYFTRYDLQVF